MFFLSAIFSVFVTASWQKIGAMRTESIAIHDFWKLYNLCHAIYESHLLCELTRIYEKRLYEEVHGLSHRDVFQ